MLRFSMKEAVYKALNPILERYISFLEVEVQPNIDGSADIRVLDSAEYSSKELKKSQFDLREYIIEGHWRKVDRFWISFVTVTKVN